MSCSLALVVGIDVVLSSDGRWIVLEANDCPLGLGFADWLHSEVKRDAALPGGGLRLLVEHLARMAQDNGILVLLPPGMGERLAELTTVRGLDVSFPTVIHRAALEIDGLRRHAADAAAPLEFAGLDKVTCNAERVYSPVLGNPGVVYVNLALAKFPHGRVSTTCVNDLRVRHICRDKLALQDLVRRVLGAGHAARTACLADRHSATDLLRTLAAGNGVAILKPRSGSGSLGVRRVKAGALLELLSSAPRTRALEEWICQEWITPSYVEHGGHRRFFDVHLYAVAGEAITAVACCAAAASDDYSAGPLTWLTTTGRLAPLCTALPSQASEAGAVVLVTPRQRDELRCIAETLVRAIEMEAAGLDLDAVIGAMPRLFQDGVRVGQDHTSALPLGLEALDLTEAC